VAIDDASDARAEGARAVVPDYAEGGGANPVLLLRAGFSLVARRRLEYSYLIELRDYVDQEIIGSVTQRLGQSWDVGASVGRGRVGYRQVTLVNAGTTPADETVLSSTVDLGYNLGRTRIGFHVERRTRQTDRGSLDRGYNRLRIGSNLTYAFQ
jgi:hypothetical protein